ncbi:hypothetical protein [Runella sp. SP2]|uniref:hypothetical protein n=1 Tax=Runella sp. SP2 TaxID=2268026 RepID=UPI0013DE61B1|nr:hypothetical protein [Runella sp. SP2]
MNNIERKSARDSAESRRISASKITLTVLLIGIGLMVAAYFAGFVTRPNEQRFGKVQTTDSAIVTESDTTIGK